MADSDKSERTILRSRVTRRVNELTNKIPRLPMVELQADLDMLKEFYDNLKILDSKILSKCREDSKVTADQMLIMEDECGDYSRKLKVCMNMITVQLNSLAVASASSSVTASGSNGNSPRHSRIKLPVLELPEFWADEHKDKLTCKRFFENFEHLTIPYNLNDTERFNLLERQCKGRAKAMISSLNVVNQTYTLAKQILIDAFDNELPQKFVFIRELSELNFKYGKDDPFIYYSKFKKLIDSVKDNNVDLDTFLLYFIWRGLPCKFQDIIVSITNKSYPDLKEVCSKFLEASNRYLTHLKHEKPTASVTGLATSLNMSTPTDSSCILCSGNNHKIAKCTRYVDAKQKIERLKELGFCFKCLKPGHMSKKCKFITSGNCMKCSKGKHWSFLCTFEKKTKVSQRSEISSKNCAASKENEGNSTRYNHASSDGVEDQSGTVTTSLSAVSSQLNMMDSLLPLLTVHTEGNCNLGVDTVLDVGSQNSFIIAELADTLQLEIIHSNISLLIKGINTTQKLITKMVKFPIQVGSRCYNVNCICIPRINIHFKTPGMNQLAKILKEKGISFAYHRFNTYSNIEEVCDIQLLIGAKDWGVVNNMESGVVGTPDRMTAFYNTTGGIILVGSISDWLVNSKFLSSKYTDCSVHTSVNEVQTLESTSTIIQLECETNSDNHCEFQIETSVGLADIGLEESYDDILDLASYAELGKTCDWILNVDSDNTHEFADIEREVTDFIIQNSTRDINGRHIMAIPWLTRYKGLLGSNERLAFKVLQSVKKKHKGKDVLQRLDEVFREQLNAGIIDRVEDFEKFKETFPGYSFLSHFPVVKDDRETTKVRVVYMANLSEKNVDGSKALSLNQCIHPGYTKNFKIADAFTLLRLDEYLMIFDISKAYHRLAISEENSSKFLFYWFRDVHNNDYTPVVYRCTRVIFGMSVSPYLLQCALYKFLVLDNDSTLSENLIDLKIRMYQGSYVDNFSLGCHNEDELNFCHDVAVDIFGKNGFPLQQFACNSDRCQNHWDSIHGDSTGAEVKILGMKWDRVKDVLKAPVYRMSESASTPRQIISTIKGAYDLQNVNLPVLNRSKLFLRDLQSDKTLKWDDSLDAVRLREWRNIARQFNEYEPLEIPRFIGRRDDKYRMILFSDASRNFLSMVVYLKNESGDVSFISAHNKIVDKTLKSRTMPVLEFLALEFAVQKGVDIYSSLSSCIVPLKIVEIMLFSDSSIALNWLCNAEYLKNKSQTRSSYLNNHIDKVVELCKTVHEIKFAHVGGKENSADFASRMVSPKILKKTCFLRGPEFLKHDLTTHDWIVIPNPEADNNPELPRFSMNKVEIESKEISVCNILKLENFSSMKKAVNVLQKVKNYVNKLICLLKEKDSKYFHMKLLPDSHKSCEIELMKADQKMHFMDIFQYFESSKQSKKSIPSLVSQMNIFLDLDDGLLKVKSKFGKLCKGSISKTPVLLNKNSEFTRILIMDYHRKFNHSGTYYILHQLRSNYFILKAYSAVKQVLNKCYHCRRFNARPVKVNVNDYKEWNINPVRRFFSHCFVDYFGPYTTKYGGEKVKTYGVIFKCIWSKMINVEVVTSANTSNFLMAFQNHVYSYGLPTRLVSDAGSNLTKAFSLIGEALSTEEVKAYLNQTGVTVCELEQYPRGSLNRGIGGIIESGVALIKKLVQGAIRNNILEFQQFTSVIKQCVCYANKKPLHTESLREQNPHDQFQVLSPEFLKFGYETAVLEVCKLKDEDDWVESKIDMNDLQKMLRVKDKLRDHYHSEFLYGLLTQATRQKGKYLPVKHTIIEKGDVVLIKDTLVKAPNYPLAKVMDVITNSLGEITQAILLKGNRSLVKRDISSIILLVKGERPEQVIGGGSDLLSVSNDENVRELRPVREAAVASRERTREMIDAADV